MTLRVATGFRSSVTGTRRTRKGVEIGAIADPERLRNLNLSE